MTANENRTSPLALIVVWLIVGLPGAWGVEQTLNKSLDLFRAPASAPAVQMGQQLPAR